jgi:hypothetical protein
MIIAHSKITNYITYYIINLVIHLNDNIFYFLTQITNAL